MSRTRRGQVLRVVVGLLAVVVLFALYAQLRQRWVGACDWYGYYEEARLFTQGRLTMPSDIDPARFPAVAPLGFTAQRGRIAPQYPPGFPILLAAGMLVGAELFVPALCAALFVWLMYLTLRRRVSETTALVFSAVWAVFPLVIWSAHNIMSDLPAALAVLACYHLLVDRDEPVAAGLVFAFSVLIRPTNALFGLLLLPLLGSWRRLVRFALPVVAIGGLYGGYNWYLFGAPWHTGYSWMGQQLFWSKFPANFMFYGMQIWKSFTPVLIVAALWGLGARKKQSLFLLAWFLLYWFLYSFYSGAGDAWWFSRYLLAGMPGLLILAVEGIEDLRLRIVKARPRWHLAVRVGMALVAVYLGERSFQFVRVEKYFEPNILGKMFYDGAVGARETLPDDSLVGSFNWSGALRLYGAFDTFSPLDPSAAAVIDDSLAAGRPVYILMEPDIAEHRAVIGLLTSFETADRIALRGGSKLKAVRVLQRRPAS